jgi:hypothetical protein
MPPLQPVDDGHPEHLVAAWYDLREELRHEIEETGAQHPTDVQQRGVDVDRLDVDKNDVTFGDSNDDNDEESEA